MTELLRVFEVTACPETGQVIDDRGDTGMRVTRILGNADAPAF